MLHGSKCYCHKCVSERVNNRPATPTAKEETPPTKPELPYQDPVDVMDFNHSTKDGSSIPELSSVTLESVSVRSINTIDYYLNRLSFHLESRNEKKVARDVAEVIAFLKSVHPHTRNT